MIVKRRKLKNKYIKDAVFNSVWVIDTNSSSISFSYRPFLETHFIVDLYYVYSGLIIN